MIKIETSQTGRFIEVFSVLILAAIWFMAIWNYRFLPETIPSHMNASGNIDGYGSKIMLFFIPGITTVTLISLMILSRYPHVYNYPLEVTEETAPRVYAFSVKMIRSLNLGIVLLFFMIEYMIIKMAYGNSPKFSLWLIPLIVVSTLAFLIYSIRKLYKLGKSAK